MATVGRPALYGNRIETGIRIEQELHKKLQDITRNEGFSISFLCSKLLKEYVKKYESNNSAD